MINDDDGGFYDGNGDHSDGDHGSDQ